MLNIFYGDMEDVIFNTSVYFKNTYEPEWIVSDLARKIILDVDKSEVIESECIKSPVLGMIPPERLSGGTKTLLLVLNEPDKIFNASNCCGDNCAKWFLTFGKMQDVTINLRHLMNFGKAPFDINILNTNQIVHSMGELVPIAGLYV
jgi:hypothetical protein